MAEEEKYSLQEAQEEAEKLQQKIGSGEAKDYQEAEEQVDQETKEAEQQVFRLAMEGDIRGALHFRDEHQLKISDSDIAQSLIEAGQGWAVAKNLSKFQGLDHKHIAEKLIDNEMGWAVAHYLSNFQGLEHKYIAERLIGAGQGRAVADYLSKFQGLDHKDIADKLIGAGEGSAVAENLSKFQGLDSHIAEKLIGAGEGRAVAKNLSNFQGLDSYIAEKLIGAGEGWAVAGNLSKFQGLDHKDIAKRLIGAGEGRAVAYYLYDFQGLDHKDIAERLINAGEGRAVAINLSKFQGLDHKDIAERLINAGEGRAVAENLYKFQGLDSHIAEKLIDDGEVSAVAHYLSNFQGLNTEVAKKLIEAGQGEAVAKHLSIFEGLNTEVAKKLIEAGEVSAVAENLYNFQGLDSHIAEELIDAGEGSAVLDNIERFAGLDISVLSRLPFSHYSYSRYLESQDEESITPEHLKLKEILEQTCLLSNELPEGVLQRDNWNAEELAEEAFPNIQDAAPASELLELGFSPLQLLRYADRDNLSRHDAFLASADIAALFKKSDLSVEDFYQNILWQVKMDDSSYEEGTAHHYLNALANRGIPTLEEIHNQIKEYSPQVQEEAKSIIADFKSNEDIFANWRSLKAFYEKCNIIQNEIETLAKIAELKEKGKDKLAEWYRLIAKSKNVSTSALNDFIARPDRFFEAEATHTDPELHEAKKPSNYYRIPNLDLTAEELRDALVEGAIDKVAAIPPMEISYEIAPKGKYLRSAIQDLEIAPRASLLLGSRKQNIEGLAADVPKLFSELNKLLRESQPPMNVNQFLSGEVQPDEATSEKIRALLDSCRLRGDLVIEKGERYLATIHPKSSPFGVLAGNDTACCMPFGDGKAVLYMMNPVCAQFTIQKEKEDGTRRTLVQSVMTLNYPIPGHSVPELIELLQSERDISQVLPDEALLNQRKLILVGDNAEAAPNFKSDLVTAGELSELLYGDFFARYLEQITSPEGRVNTTQIQIGLNSDVLHNLPQVPNETIPLAPLSYSDNIESTSYQLRPKKAPAGRVKLEIRQLPDRKIDPVPSGVSDLTYADTLSTAFLESKAYKDAQDLLTGLHNMENALIAKDINNSFKERPNLSLKFVDRDGHFRSYILAYQGVYEETGEPCIYISDFASDRQTSSAGFVLKHFCQRYKENYLDQNNTLPIFAEMRESTSYKLITDNKEMIEGFLGATINIEEIDSYSRGDGEKIHVVKITVNNVNNS